MSILVNDTWCKARKTEHESKKDLELYKERLRHTALTRNIFDL